MKQAIKAVVALLVRNGLVWFLLRATFGPIAKAYSRLARLRGWDAPEQRRFAAEQARFAEKCNSVFEDRQVLSGPFEGMQYPSMRSHGSMLYPKLLGTYEMELHGLLSALGGRDYDAVVDIGCAEGYYAVGLGRMFPRARVYAFDTVDDALQQCRAMADLNEVRLTTGDFCDRAALERLDLGRRALIVSDCEGYEYELFDEAVASRLSRHDFLIETHDFLRIDSTQHILNAFHETHDCFTVTSTDDIIKAYTCDMPTLAGFDLTERWQLLRELRPTIMRWVFASARKPD